MRRFQAQLSFRVAKRGAVALQAAVRGHRAHRPSRFGKVFREARRATSELEQCRVELERCKAQLQEQHILRHVLATEATHELHDRCRGCRRSRCRGGSCGYGRNDWREDGMRPRWERRYRKAFKGHKERVAAGQCAW